MRMIITLLVLAVMVGALVWQYKVQVLALEDHKRQQHDQSVSETVAVQAKCTAQAQQRFALLGLGSGQTATFKSHYDAKTDKCFVQVESTSSSLGTVWHNVTLYEAVKGIVFGTYSWRSVPGQKAADVAPYTCEVKLPSGERRTCRSDAEFKGFVRTYMQ